VINSIDATKTPNSAEESNQRKIKAVYESCMDLVRATPDFPIHLSPDHMITRKLTLLKSRLNEVGIKPFVPLADFLIDTFGPFDLNPAPDAEIQSVETEWRGSWDEAYEVPQELVARSDRLEELRVAAKTGGWVWERPTMERTEFLDNDDDVESLKPDTERRDRITKTLAWLHSRGGLHSIRIAARPLLTSSGVEGLVNFEIEGDAGGEDSQVQSLWLYQSFGGLPSKEYYEEAPILDLYQSVVAGMLTDIASNTHASSKHPKRDVFDEFLQELVEVEAEGWPWPWPGDDKGDGEDDGGKHPDVPGSKDEPLDKRMEKLAGKVVRFERELMRAGADPEYLFNPHFAYNPYPVQKVYKALPFLDIPAYLSTFAPRTYPENITVTHPPYLKAVSQIVEDTPDYVLSGYFVTRLAMTYAGALGQKTGVWKEARRLKEVLQGIKKGTEENRQDTCLNWLDGIVGYIVGREFVHEAFSAEAKKEGEDIINCEWFST
jgi:endothelin-converting enzyme